MSFIKNEYLIQETYKIKDLIDFFKKEELLFKKINTLKQPTILGLVGRFGIGKSTFLHNMKKNKFNDNLWIHFDAWKYPDRKNLWEGFVLDFASQIGIKKKIVKKIDGKDTKSTIFDILTDIASGLSGVPNLNFLDKFVDFFKKSPAIKVFQLQDILKEIISNQEKNIVVVVEDIDRSGDSGIYFLETLSQFIKGLKIEKKIVVIVPISETSYYDNINSYEKSIDLFDFFDIKSINLEKFVDEVFDESIFVESNSKTQLVSFLEQLFIEYPEMTLRKLKLILRKANVIYNTQIQDKWKPDFRVTIGLEASKYFYIDNDKKLSYYDSFKEERKINPDNIFNTLLFSILTGRDEITENDHKEVSERTGYYKEKIIKKLVVSNASIEIIEKIFKEDPSIPYYNSYQKIKLIDSYFNY